MPDTKKLNPLVTAAAIAVIIFSAVGVGVMSGLIPGARSSNEALNLGDSKPAPANSSTEAKPAPGQGAPPQAARKRTAQADGAPQQRPQPAASERPRAAAPVPPPATRVCAECGIVNTVNVVEKQGSGSGLGAVGGAVVGGLLGHQVGSGRGNTAATVIGAAGGAYAGHEVEKRVKTESEYHVTVRTEDGRTHNFVFESAPGLAVGERVRVIDGRLVKG